MQLTLNILLVLCLVLVVVQDLKQRSISWVLIPLMLAGFVARALLYENSLWKDALLNILFMVVQLLLLTIYMSIKNKKLVNIIDTYLGLGDVLFFVVICTAFSPVNFIVFYLISLVFTLTTVLAYNTIAKKATKDIPLAGAMAAAMIILMLLPGIDFYDDGFLLGLIGG